MAYCNNKDYQEGRGPPYNMKMNNDINEYKPNSNIVQLKDDQERSNCSPNEQNSRGKGVQKGEKTCCCRRKLLCISVGFLLLIAFAFAAAFGVHLLRVDVNKRNHQEKELQQTVNILKMKYQMIKNASLHITRFRENITALHGKDAELQSQDEFLELLMQDLHNSIQKETQGMVADLEGKMQRNLTMLERDFNNKTAAVRNELRSVKEDIRSEFQGKVVALRNKMQDIQNHGNAQHARIQNKVAELSADLTLRLDTLQNEVQGKDNLGRNLLSRIRARITHLEMEFNSLKSSSVSSASPRSAGGSGTPDVFIRGLFVGLGIVTVLALP